VKDRQDNSVNEGQTKQIHSTRFVSGLESNYSSSGGWKTVGCVTPDGAKVPEEYLVTVSSIRNKCSVISILQDPIQMNIASKWEPFIPTTLLNKGNLAAQLVSLGHRSLITKASSRRVWMGTTPISLSLNMKFESISDSSKEVTEAFKTLQQICCPSDPSGGQGISVFDMANALSSLNPGKIKEALSKAPTLIPPGPSPFTMEGVLNLRSAGNLGGGIGINATEERIDGGDVIIIEIGRFLTFYNVIVNDVKVTVPPKMAISGDPISASVNITFETYEMITREELDKMYTKGVLSTG